MSFPQEVLNELAQLAIDAALTAGRIINAGRDKELTVHRKSSGTSAASQVVTEVDHQAQAAIVGMLQASCTGFDLALLAEESADDAQRQIKPAFWCVDPMDGTLAFVNNTPGFAVSIALVARDGHPLIGVVHDPVEQTLFHAIHGQGAYRNGRLIQATAPDPERPLTLITDFSFKTHSRLDETRAGLTGIARIEGMKGAEIEFRIGAVMNACAVLETPNSCYFKYPRLDDSGGSLWDYAATACLFAEAGAIASDIYGQPMELNRPDSTFMNHRGVLYAGSQCLADALVLLNRNVSVL